MSWNKEEAGRDGKPRPNGMLQALEVDAIHILRDKAANREGANARLNARHYLLTCCHWTVDEVNAARDAKEGPS
jgi:hypothetical protein